MIKTFKVGKWSVLILLSIVSLILYFPILSKGFVSDDFTVLYRLINSRDFTPPGFFRPGADLSLYSTYLFSGLNPVAYNVTNLVIHILNAWLVYLVCSKFFFSKPELHASLPLFASIIFLLFPFHQEPIVWVLGRGILLSSTFALLALYVLLLGAKNFKLLIAVSALLYFMSLLCYESGIFIPVIALLIFRSQKAEPQEFNWLIVLFGISFIAHVILRFYFSGSLIGVYGKEFNSFAPGQFVYEYIKFWLRLVMIPLSDVTWFLVSASLIILSLIYAGYKIVNRDHFVKRVVIGLFFILIISFLIPAFFGITIRTSEGDRFLYFPSIFFSVYVGLIFTSKGYVYRVVFILCTVVFLMIIYSNNKKWLAAASQVQQIVNVVRENSGTNMIIYNLPGSKNGKYIFRNGFREALYLNQIDTTGIFVNNIVEDGLASLDQIIEPPVRKNDENEFQLIGKNPFNLIPPFKIINITDKKIQVYKVGN